MGTVRHLISAALVLRELKTADMADSTQETTLIVRYILGQVSAQERADLEERYFADRDFFEQMVAAEHDLIDSYVRGELSGPTRFQFENRFLATPELRERVRSARAIAGYRSGTGTSISAPDTRKAITRRRPMLPALRFAFAGLALALLVWGSWVMVLNLRLHREIDLLTRERANIERQQQELQRQIADLTAQIKQGQGATPPEIAQLEETGKPIISLVIVPGIPRSGGHATILPVSSGVSSALLWLKTGPDSYAIYSATLETPEGRQILKRDALKIVSTRNGRMVLMPLPSTVLQRGDYVIRLFGGNGAGQAEEIADYGFRVVPH